MAESLHKRYDRDERRLLATAATEIATDNLLDAVIDVASPVIAASAWDGLRPTHHLGPQSASRLGAR